MSRLSKLLNQARENVSENVEGVDLSIPADDAAAAIADTTLPSELAETVAVPTAELNTGLNQVENIVADAERLDAAADTLEATLQDDGQGSDASASSLVTDDATASLERWSVEVKTTHTHAKENFNSSKGRRDATRATVQYAREAAEGMMDRAVNAVKTAWEWLANIIKEVFDRSLRITNRAKALAGQAKNANAGQPIKVGGLKALGRDGAIEASNVLLGLATGLDKVYSIDPVGATNSQPIQLNQHGLGGNTFTISYEGDKVSFESNEMEGAGKQSVTSLSPADCSKVCANVIAGMRQLDIVKRLYEKGSKDNSVMEALKNKESKNGALSRVIATTRASGAILNAGAAAAAKLLDIVEQSVNAGGAKALPAPAAAAA